MKRAVVPVALGLALSACTPARDPASEAPVDMNPGLYVISGGAKGVPSATSANAPGGGPKEVCLTSGRLEGWPLPFVREYAALHPGCSSDGLKRTGNAFSGSFSCPVDPEKATGAAKVTYEGEVSETETELRTNVAFDMEPVNATEEEKRQLAMGKAMMSAMTLAFKATRKGDCSS